MIFSGQSNVDTDQRRRKNKGCFLVSSGYTLKTLLLRGRAGLELLGSAPRTTFYSLTQSSLENNRTIAAAVCIRTDEIQAIDREAAVQVILVL